MLFIKNFHNTFNNILDLIFPSKCISCHEFNLDINSLCYTCFKNIEFISEKQSCKICANFLDIPNPEQICNKCFNHTPEYNKIISCFYYNDFIKELIYKFKYYDHLHLGLYFSNQIHTRITDITHEIDYIIPTPLHFFKLFKRTYNQSAVLGKHLSKISGIKIYYNILKRIKNTKPQNSLDFKDRASNVENAFIIENKKMNLIKNKNILLIDDIITTSNTINECVKPLKEAGVNKIYIASICRTKL